MKFKSVVGVILFSLLQFTFSVNAQSKCDFPLQIGWVATAANATCTDTIYAFTYNNEKYIYLTRKGECLAADWTNQLYNCNTDTYCSVSGFTQPEDQCSDELLGNIDKYFTNDFAIHPVPLNCKASPHLQAENGDIYVDSPCYGLILTAPNGVCFRLSVKSDGVLSTFPTRCPY